MTWPAISTAGDLLARHGLVKKRRRRRAPYHPGVVPPVTAGPNDLWATDFKGQFRTGDGIDCYPLTVTDQHTRFLLACHGLLSTRGVGVRPIFDRLFREYGLPGAMRPDNGVPFASTSLHGLTPLNVWWLRLGIQHQRILPAHPQQNGAHERMHKTFKQAPFGRPGRRSPASYAPSTGFARSTTTSARINSCGAARPVRSIAPRRGRTPGLCPRSSIHTTFSSSGSRTRARFDSSAACFISRPHSKATESASRKSTTASGHSSSGRSCWGASTNVVRS